jgi:hypothetical protein
MYNALQDHQETKQFESYLLIKDRIVNESKNDVQKALLAQLETAYKM